MTITRTRMKHGSREFDVTEVTRAFGHSLTTSLALEVPVNCAHAGVHEASHLRLSCGLVHDLRVLNLRDRVCFLNIASARAPPDFQCSGLTISSGERMPNWTSFTFRIGAAEYAN